MATKPVIKELLLKGADDWIMAADVAWIAKSMSGASTDDEVADLALATISEVVSQGLMQLGDVTDGGFFEWDLSPALAIERAARHWRSLGRLPDVGEVCWLANTAAGDLQAKSFGQLSEP
jgi:hypothetical protein